MNNSFTNISYSRDSPSVCMQGYILGKQTHPCFYERESKILECSGKESGDGWCEKLWLNKWTQLGDGWGQRQTRIGRISNWLSIDKINKKYEKNQVVMNFTGGNTEMEHISNSICCYLEVWLQKSSKHLFMYFLLNMLPQIW